MVKPLLNCLPMSGKDTDIWHLVVDRFYASKRAPRYAFTGLWSGSLTQGRRDAELMLQAQEIAQFGPAAIQLFGIDCRGWTCDQLMWLDAQSDERQV